MIKKTWKIELKEDKIYFILNTILVITIHSCLAPLFRDLFWGRTLWRKDVGEWKCLPLGSQKLRNWTKRRYIIWVHICSDLVPLTKPYCPKFSQPPNKVHWLQTHQWTHSPTRATWPCHLINIFVNWRNSWLSRFCDR